MSVCERVYACVYDFEVEKQGVTAANLVLSRCVRVHLCACVCVRAQEGETT